MQWDKFSARRDMSDARLSGISVKRFDDRSRELRVLATGARLAAEMDVNEFSGSPRCRKNRHFEGGSTPGRRVAEPPVR
jgi:hypothetical protein